MALPLALSEECAANALCATTDRAMLKRLCAASLAEHADGKTRTAEKSEQRSEDSEQVASIGNPVGIGKGKGKGDGKAPNTSGKGQQPEGSCRICWRFGHF